MQQISKSTRLLPLLFLLSTASLAAQTLRIPFQRLSLADGLSQGTVNCILQDSTGFLWIGTQDGLNRFDGNAFEVYKNDPTDPTSLPASWIEALAEDAEGNLWIGTQGGLAIWRRQSGALERYRHSSDDPQGPPSGAVRALLLDRQGGLWVGMFQSGLARLDLESGKVERFRHDPEDPRSLADDRIRALYQDRAGDLWIGTLGGLSRFDPEGRAFNHFRHRPDDPRSLSDNRVFAILEDASDFLWVGTEGGLNRSTDPAAGFERFIHEPGDPRSLANDWVTALLEDRTGRLWIATDGGLHLFRSAIAASFERFQQEAGDPLSLSNNRLLDLFQDRGGVLWVGTQGGGLNHWNPVTWSFAHYRSTEDGEGLSSNAVFALAEDRTERLFVGTLGGLDVLDRDLESGQRWQRYRHDPTDPQSLPGDQVTALHTNRNGVLWVGTLGSGLGRLEPSSDRFRNYRHDPDQPGSLSNNDVSAILEDRDGVLWVATYRGGLNRFDPERPVSTPFEHLRHDPESPDSLSNDHLTALADGASGVLWIGTFGGGLNRLDAERQRFEHLRHDPDRPESLSNDTVYALHHDAAGNLWVGTQVGLNRLVSYEEGRFEHYFERDGLPNDVIWGIQSDDHGRLWLSTNNGLSRFDPATGEFKNYNTSHGLQANEFNFGAHFKSASGELFFGGVNGFNAFDPAELSGNTAVPPVVLTSFSIRNQPLRRGGPVFDLETVRLGHRDYFFDLEVAALDFTAPEENRYRYLLEGFNEDWIELGPRRRLTFTSLDPGDYRLFVQGSNNDGVWNRDGVSLAITVVPPPWATWWAYTLYVLAAVSALSAFVYSQHRKVEREREQVRERELLLSQREKLIRELERKNTELERFNFTLSHDLRTPLVTIKGFLGLLERDVAGGKWERLETDVERISSAADRMSDLLDELLDFARLSRVTKRSELVSLRELVDEALELLEGPIAESGAEIEIAPGLPTVLGDRLRLRQLLEHLLENALKYAPEKARPKIEIGFRHNETVSQEGERVLFVRDNGIGIEPQYHRQIFSLFERLDASDQGTGIGLALVQRIAELHGGRVWVESEGLGCGSTFFFSLGPRQAPDEATRDAAAAGAPGLPESPPIDAS